MYPLSTPKAIMYPLSTPEDAGEALGVGEVGEHTAETLDLLLCLSKMMTARRRLVWDKEFICLAAGMLRNSYVRL